MNFHFRRPALALAALLAACGGGAGAPTPAVVATPLPEVGAVVAPVATADPGSALPDGWQQGAFMEIYVRAYQDSDGDGIGDLRGLISRLDYLQALGVTGLWLMPVTRSQDQDHGYAVTDYRDIEPAYGTLADLDELLRQAHARGIGVILDYVMNHSAAQHPLFRHASAAADDTWRDWYVWQDPAPTGWQVFGANPWRASASGAYYAPFSAQMPDFNLKHPATVAWHQDNLRFWLNRGVDGFRFDAVGHLVENGANAWQNQPQNYALMHDARVLLDGYQRRHMVCEAPDDPRGFGAAGACGSAFAFDLAGRILAALRGDATALAAIRDQHASAASGQANFLSNHDSFAGQRPWDALAGDEAAYRLAAAFSTLLPGTPFLYYGEEIGLSAAAGLGGDAALRTPMSWTAESRGAGFTSGTPFRALSANAASRNVDAQQADPDSLLAHYRALLRLRQQRPSLTRGDAGNAFVDGPVIGWQRRLDGETTLVLINTGRAPASTSLSGLPPSTRLTPLLPASADSVGTDADGRLSLNLPAQSLRVYDLP